METIEAAKRATRQAFWAAVVVASFMVLFATLGALGSGVVRSLGLDAWAFVDAALFAAIAVGLRKQSKVAAWAGLLLFCAEKLYFWSRNGFQGLPLAIILILAFIGGVRGTTALSRRTSVQAATSEQPFAD